MTSWLWEQVPLIKTYVREHTVRLKPRTEMMYYQQINTFIQFCCHRWDCHPSDLDFTKCTIMHLGERKLYTPIRRDLIEQYLGHIAHPSIRDNANTVLYMIFEYFVHDRLIDSNPVPKPKIRTWNHPSGLTIKQIHELAKRLVDMPQPYGLACILGLSSGLRPNEICALRIDDLQEDETGWTVSVCREAQKGRRAGLLPLPDLSKLMTDYWTWRERKGIQSDHLFTDKRHKPITTLLLRRRLAKVTIDGMTRAITPYDLRRSYATLMDLYVSNPDVLVQAMRHKVGDHDSVTRGYVAKPELTIVDQWTKRLPVVQLSETLAALWLKRK